MDTLFHFVISFLAGMAVNTRLKFEPAVIAGLAASSVLIDLDHLVFMYPRALHTVWIAAMLPLAGFYTAYRYERSSDSIKYQSVALVLMVMLLAHLTTDLFYEGSLRPFYPALNLLVEVPETWRLSFVQHNWELFTPESILMGLNAAIVAAVYYAENFIYFFEKRHENLKNAFTDTLEN